MLATKMAHQMGLHSQHTKGKPEGFCAARLGPASPPPTESWERFGGGGSAGPRLAAYESIVIGEEYCA